MQPQRNVEAYSHSPNRAGASVTGSAEAEAARERVTWRAVVLGALLCLLIGVGAPYSTHLLQGSYMDLDYSTPAAVFLLFVLVVFVSPLLRLLKRRALSAAEIAVIWTMMIMACALTTMGMASQLVPTLAAARYYAQTETAWNTQVLPYIKPWLLPDAFASERLFTGLKPGETIPWAAWAAPLAIWAVLLLALYTVSICLMAIFRRPWVERERLAYPLTQLPLEMARSGTQAGERPLLRDAVMWAGFATAFLLPSMRGMHHYAPSFPDFETVWKFPMFRETLELTWRISFPMIGFFFLANPEAVFTLWVFNRIAWTVHGWMNLLGTQYRADLGPYSADPPFGYIALGAFLGLAFTTVRAAWPHLRAVARMGVGRGALEDADEPMSYRTAFWGVVCGLAVMAVWLHLAGMPLFVVPIFLFGVLAIFLALTRIVIESGMAEAISPTAPAGFTHVVLGNQMIGPQALAVQSLSYIWAGDLRTLVMTSAAHGYRLSDLVKGHRRTLTGTMALAILIAACAAVGTTLTLGYTRGGVSLNSWFFIGGAEWPYKWIAERNANPVGPNVSGWAMALGGGLFAGLLAFLRQRYVWFPFHPVGFAVAPIWLVDEVWFSAFIAWLLRGLIVRYGGLRGYRRCRPYFL
ncbi:MAG TPA: DUF6785 family protein, partial [Chthonomonadaceae bacterium]|nr:DUF6785 family protein [Chthonomonadaceae bacterium]